MNKKQIFPNSLSTRAKHFQMDIGPEYGLACSPPVPKMLTKELSKRITDKLVILSDSGRTPQSSPVRDVDGKLTFAARKEIFRIIQHELETAKDVLPEDLGLADKI